MEKNNNFKRRMLALGLALSCFSGLPGCKDIEEGNTANKDGETTINSVNTEVIENETDVQTSEAPHYGYTDEDISRFIEESKFEYSCPNEIFDVDSLYEKLLVNSNVSGKENMFFCSQEASKEEQEEIALYRRALLRALHICFDEASNDVYEDFCKFGDIKIVRAETGSVASFYYEKNLLTVNTAIIKLDCETSAVEKDLEEYIALVLAHELNHVRQFACRHSGYKAYSVMDFGFSTCIESSAESQKYNMGPVAFDNKILTYSSIRRSEDLLFLIPSCLAGKTVEEYYNSMFDSDLMGLYDFFNINSWEDYRTFYDILYSIETLDGRTEFLKDCSGDKRVLAVGPAYKVDIFRMALANLTRTVEEENISIEDVLTLYSIVKGEVISCNPRDVQFSSEYMNELEKGLDECETEFRIFVESHYGITSEEFYDILDFTISERYNVITEDSLLDRFPIVRNVLLAHPIAKEELVAANGRVTKDKTITMVG